MLKKRIKMQKKSSKDSRKNPRPGYDEKNPQSKKSSQVGKNLRKKNIK